MPRPLTSPQSPVKAKSLKRFADPALVGEIPQMIALLQETYGFLGGGEKLGPGGSVVYADTPLCREIGELLRKLEHWRKTHDRPTNPCRVAPQQTGDADPPVRGRGEPGDLPEGSDPLAGA